MMPHDLPPWRTVWGYFRRWRKDGKWERIHDALALKSVGVGKERAGTLSSCNRQPECEDHRKGVPRGYDAGKKVKGRKRHIVVDIMGLLLAVVVHAANIQDRDGAKLALRKLQGRFSRLRLIWADGAYAGQLVDWASTLGGGPGEVVKRAKNSHSFEVLPRRWVVERTLGWLGRNRRLSEDYTH